MPKSEPTIQKFMTTQPQSIESKDKLEKAKDVMAKYGIRHLPVMREGEVIGMLSDREINLAYGLEGVEPTSLLVVDACSGHPYIVEPDEPLRLAAQEMANKHHGSAVVMQNGKLVGIFTTVDACRALSWIIEENIKELNLKTLNYIRHSVDRRGE